MMRFPEDTPLGQLQIDEVYEFYDGPRLLSCHNSAEQNFLAISVEDSATTSRWLYCPISLRRLAELEHGNFELYSAFRTAETGYVHHVIFDAEGESFSTLSASMLNDSDLPYPGERLSPRLEDQRMAVPVAAEHARQTRRETLRLALAPRGMVGNEAPSRLLGQVLVCVQELVSAIGHALTGAATTRGRLPPDVIDATELRAVGSFTGSFGVELAASRNSDMFDESPISEALEHLSRLVDAESDVEVLTSMLQELKPRVASKYMKLIGLLDDAKSGITIDWGAVRRDRGSIRELSAEALAQIYAALVLTGASDSIVFEVTGVLVGLNTRTRSFELQSRTDGRRISGRLDATRFASEEEFTINALYVATIEETTEVSGLTGEESVSRLLRDLSDPTRPAS